MAKWPESWLKEHEEQQGLSDEELDRRALQKVRGQISRKQGDGFEATVDQFSASYLSSGALVRYIVQVPPMRPVKVGKKLLFQPTDKGPCDRVFQLPSAVMGIFDMKTTRNQKAFTWPTEKTHQLTELRTVHAATDGVSPAFALLEWIAYGEVCLHPVETIEGATLHYDDGLTVTGYDWLATVRRYWI